jgi:hypothetical protein
MSGLNIDSAYGNYEVAGCAEYWRRVPACVRRPAARVQRARQACVLRANHIVCRRVDALAPAHVKRGGERSSAKRPWFEPQLDDPTQSTGTPTVSKSLPGAYS